MNKEKQPYYYLIYEFSRLKFGLLFILMAMFFVSKLSDFIFYNKDNALSLTICSAIVTIVMYSLYKYYSNMSLKIAKELKAKEDNIN